MNPAPPKNTIFTCKEYCESYIIHCLIHGDHKNSFKKLLKGGAG